MKFWKRLRYWQIGAAIGFLLSFLPFLEGIIDKFYIINDSLLLVLPRNISDFFWDCWLCIPQIIIINLIQFVLIGSVIGLIIEEIKNQKKVNPKH